MNEQSKTHYGNELEKAYDAMSPYQFQDIMRSMGIGETCKTRNMFFKEIGSLEGLSVLEIGVGTGFNSGFYKEANSFTGTDISQNMLNQSSKRFEAEGLENYDIVDISSPTLKEKQFDVVIMTYTLSGTRDMKKLFQDALKYVKKGGRIAILDSYAFSPEKNVDLILEDKFERGVGLRDTPFNVFYSQRKNFKILKNLRMSTWLANEYILIGEKR